jgi:hypothetical protein
MLKRTFNAYIVIRFLGFIEQEIALNNFLKNIFLINSIRAFDWCVNCHIWKKTFFLSFLTIRGDPYLNNRNFFLSPNMIIHTPIESPELLSTRTLKNGVRGS